MNKFLFENPLLEQILFLPALLNKMPDLSTVRGFVLFADSNCWVVVCCGERKGVVRFGFGLLNCSIIIRCSLLTKLLPYHNNNGSSGEQKIICIKRSENLEILMPKQFSMLQCRVVHKLLECFRARERRRVECLESDFDGSPFRMLLCRNYAGFGSGWIELRCLLFFSSGIELLFLV